MYANILSGLLGRWSSRLTWTAFQSAQGKTSSAAREVETGVDSMHYTNRVAAADSARLDDIGIHAHAWKVPRPAAQNRNFLLCSE